MITFAVGFISGIGLSCLIAWFAASSMQREHDDTESFLRHSRDTMSEALKERNDEFFKIQDQLKQSFERRDRLIRVIQTALENN